MTHSFAISQPPHLTHIALSTAWASRCGAKYGVAPVESGTTFSGISRPNNLRALPTKYFRHHDGLPCFNRLASTKAKTMIIDADRSGRVSDIANPFKELSRPLICRELMSNCTELYVTVTNVVAAHLSKPV